MITAFCLNFPDSYTQLLHAVSQGAGIDPEHGRGAFGAVDAAVGQVQNVFDVAARGSVQRQHFLVGRMSVRQVILGRSARVNV